MTLCIHPNQRVKVKQLNTGSIGVQHQHIIGFGVQVQKTLVMNPLDDLCDLLCQGYAYAQRLRAIGCQCIFRGKCRHQVGCPVAGINVDGSGNGIVQSFCIKQTVAERKIRPEFILCHFELIRIRRISTEATIVRSFDTQLERVAFLDAYILQIAGIGFVSCIVDDT